MMECRILTGKGKKMCHKEKALQLFSEGYLCSQPVLAAYAEEYKLSVEQAL